MHAKLFWPVMVFGAFMFLGFVNGVLVKGGDRNAAVWEFRPMLYLLVLYVLVTNIFTSRAPVGAGRLWFLIDRGVNQRHPRLHLDYRCSTRRCSTI